MKKYFHLTSADGIQYHVLHDGTVVPEAPEQIRKNPENLNKFRSGISVSITMPTHRIFPDNNIDSINLKNLVTEAEQKLLSVMDKKEAEPIINNIKEAQNAIDYRKSFDGLVLYANANFSAVVKLPIDIKEEVVVDDFFDMCPLYKAIQQNRTYYILTVSLQKIRFLEAFNDQILMEYENDDFPFVNTEYYTDDPTKLRQDIFMDNLIKEFFNVADKRLQKYLTENPEPLILAGDVKTVAYFNEMMDDSRHVIAQVNGSFDQMPFHEIIKNVYPLIEVYRKEKDDVYFNAIEKAKSAGLLVTDVNEIYNVVLAGNADTLFIAKDFNLKGEIKDNIISLSDKGTKDIILALIDKTTKAGGKIIFCDDDLLKKYRHLSLIKRF